MPDGLDLSFITSPRQRDRRERLLTLLGPVCAVCGFSDPRALQVDHINQTGTTHRRSFSNQLAYYDAVIEEIGAGSKDYQVLCANCNQIKRVENREFPQPRGTTNISSRKKRMSSEEQMQKVADLNKLLGLSRPG